MLIISSVFIMVPPIDDLLGSIDIMEPIKLEFGISSKLLIFILSSKGQLSNSFAYEIFLRLTAEI